MSIADSPMEILQWVQVNRNLNKVRWTIFPRDFCVGDYGEDAAFRGTFHRWLAQLWEEKDRRIDELIAGGAARAVERR
jgi:hypothetical protein